MRKLKKCAILIALLLCAAGLCGCDEQQLVLGDLETTVYEHPYNGAKLTLPADWEMLSETDEVTLFSDSENSISLGVARELAGFSYYPNEDLADLAAEVCSAVLTEPEILQREQLPKPDNAVLVTAAGKIKDGDGEAVCQVTVISPLSAVRYFIVVTAESNSYEKYQNVLRDIYAGFTLNKTEDEIYQQITK